MTIERFEVGKRVVRDSGDEGWSEGTIIDVTRRGAEVIAVSVEWDEPGRPAERPEHLAPARFRPEDGLYLEEEWQAALQVVSERLLAEWEAHQRGDENAILRAAQYLAGAARGKYCAEAN